MTVDLRADFDEAIKAKESGDLLRATQILSELHERAPESAGILVALGDVLWDLNRCDEAGEFFRKATRLKPECELASLGLFHCLWEVDRIDEAFDEMRRFLSEYKSELYTRLLADLNRNGRPS